MIHNNKIHDNNNIDTPNPKAQNRRPYVIINCAMSLDGKIALPTGKPIKLSSLEDFKRVHELRNYSDAILVGINTVLKDDPKLTVKSEFVSKPRKPIRIILDTRGRTPKNAEVLDGNAPTLIVMGEDFKKSNSNFKNAEILYCPQNDEGLIMLDELLMRLKTRGIDNLMVEGGSTVIYNFLNNHLVDELYVYLKYIIIGGTETPTLAAGLGAKTSEDVIKLKIVSIDNMIDGILLKYKL